MQAHTSVPFPLQVFRFVLRAIGRISPQIAGYIMFKVFSTPIKRMKIELASNPKQFTIKHKNRLLTGYEWQGTGKTVLLVHGWESSPARFNKLIRLLVEQGYHVFAMDAPAHGKSEGRQTNPLDYADALYAFTQTIGHVDTVIAHSLGGSATMNLFSHYPDFAPNRVVLIGAVDHPQQAVDFFTQIFNLLPTVAQEMARRMEQSAGETMDEVSSAYIAQSRTEDALIIHDNQDKLVPVTAGQAISQAWDGARYLETSGLGHRRILNDDAVLAEVLDFIMLEKVPQ